MCVCVYATTATTKWLFLASCQNRSFSWNCHMIGWKPTSLGGRSQHLPTLVKKQWIFFSLQRQHSDWYLWLKLGKPTRAAPPLRLQPLKYRRRRTPNPRFAVIRNARSHPPRCFMFICLFFFFRAHISFPSMPERSWNHSLQRRQGRSHLSNAVPAQVFH